jgi:hypothetical protein
VLVVFRGWSVAKDATASGSQTGVAVGDQPANVSKSNRLYSVLNRRLNAV